MGRLSVLRVWQDIQEVETVQIVISENQQRGGTFMFGRYRIREGSFIDYARYAMAGLVFFVTLALAAGGAI